jgi:solute carrier family 25 carnitine/acylcarnitine transporter 20/29
MNNTLEIFIPGTFIGLSQSLIGHPLDTIKTQLQSGISRKNIEFLNFKNLYKGVQYQLCISIINSSLTFYIFDKIYAQTNSSILAGSIAGITSGLFINPIEIYKVRTQCNNFTTSSNTKIPKSLGLKYTMTREIFAFTTYFTVYTKLKERENPFPTPINGGLAGCASWCIGYPIDTLKTIKQSGIGIDNTSSSIKPLLKTSILYRGFSICMIRAFLVNSINFTIYEYFQSVFLTASSSGFS